MHLHRKYNSVMKKRVTLEKVITIVKLSLWVTWFWPLPPNTSKRKVLCMYLFQCVSILLTIAVIASMIYAIVKNMDNPDLVAKAGLGLFPCTHVIWNILCHFAVYQRLQRVTFEMENFCAVLKSHEKIIVQRKYIDKCANFYWFCITSFYMTLLILFAGPIILDQPLPVFAEFPFDASRQPFRTITYLHQIIVGLQIAAQLSVNAFMALLLWLASARLEILSEDLRKITNIYNFTKCIEKHQRLLECAREITLVVRPFALGTVFFSTAALIIHGLIFLEGAVLSLKIQCIFTTISALVEVFMYTWPAEHLIYISTNVAHAIFEWDWYNKSDDIWKTVQIIILRSQKSIFVTLPCGLPSLSLRYYASSSNIGKAAYASPWYSQNVYLQSNINIILMRCQKPVTVSVACIIPMLSLQYFGSFISTVCSYFTALRVVLNKDNINED